MRQDHPLAEAFRVAWTAAARQIVYDLPGVAAPELTAWFLDGFGLVIRVDALDAWYFEPAFLARGPHVGGQMLTPGGRGLWDRVHNLGRLVLGAHAADDDWCVALMLADGCVNAAAAQQAAILGESAA